MKGLITSAILLALAVTGCNAPLPDRSLKQYVSEKDVIGEWELTPASLALLVRDGFKPPAKQNNRITFRADGTCDFHSILESLGNDAHCGVEVTGKWALEKDTMTDSNVPKKNTIRMELALPSTVHITYLNFDRRDGQLVLWSYYGDPDSWEFMEYTRRHCAGPPGG